MRKTTRRSSRQADNTKNIIGISVCVAILLLIFAFLGYQFMGETKPTYDRVTGCPIVNGEISPNNHMVIMIDSTDSLTQIQSDFLKVEVNNLIKHEVSAGDLLSIYILDDQSRHKKPIFQMCKIRDGSDADRLTENEALMKRKFNKQFQQPLNRIVEGILNLQKSANSSPIFEMIQSIAVNSFNRWTVRGEEKLIVFSDMLHNTEEYTHYKRGVNFKNFKRTNYAQETKAELPNVLVKLYYFANKPQFQKNENMFFWRGYFKSSQALVEEIRVIGK